MNDATWVLCLDARDYEVSLVARRLYRTVPDPDAENDGWIRVIDETGEDYLFPRDRFAPVNLPREVLDRLAS